MAILRPLASLCLTLSYLSVQAEDHPLDTIQPLVVEWAKLRAESVRLQEQWNHDRRLASGSLEVAKERLELLETKQRESLAQQSEERRQLEEVRQRVKEARQALGQAEEEAKALSQDLLALRAALPPRLSDALSLTYASLKKTEATPSERFQWIFSIIGRCQEFNRVITLSEEVVAADALGKDRLLPVLYWGLAHAYALDTSTKRAFLGRPVEGKWTWTEVSDDFSSIEHLHLIFREKADPTFAVAPSHPHLPLLNR